MRFENRTDAGKQLAEKLEKYSGEDVIIYALPRGGVVLGYEVAKHLDVPLDIVIARKIGHPNNLEYAVCAIAEDGHTVCDENEKALLDQKWFYNEAERERNEAKRRREAYMKGKKMPSAEGKTAIIVDDGIATGLTLRMAIKELRHKNPKKIVVAVPVSPKDSADKIKEEADDFVAIDIPQVYIGAVGAYYDDFGQVTDKEVVGILEKS